MSSTRLSSPPVAFSLLSTFNCKIFSIFKQGRKFVQEKEQDVISVQGIAVCGVGE
jgi:hypothetical protein